MPAVAPASPADEAELRRLLRATPVGKRVRFTCEREPSFFRAEPSFRGPTTTAVVRREGSGSLVGVACRTVRPVHGAGKVLRAGFLHSVRAVTHEVLPELVAFLRGTRGKGEAPFDVVVFPRDDAGAWHGLEEVTPLFGQVQDLGTLVAHVVPVSGQPHRDGAVAATGVSPAAVLACLGRAGRAGDLVPVVRDPDLAEAARQADLSVEGDFLVVPGDGGVRACAALWDQSGFKQVVARSYGSGGGLLSRLLGAAGPRRGLRLPAPGSVLKAAFVSHVGVDGDDPGLFADLVSASVARARKRRLGHVVVGLAPEDPLGETFRASFRSFPVPLAVVALGWDADAPRALRALGHRPLRPDLALVF